MSHAPSFGGWVRWRRKLLDLTREELAARVGCAAVSIRRIEVGERRPSKQLAGLLASALELGEEERTPFLLAARRELAADGLPAPPGLAGAILQRGHTNLPAQLTPLIGREHEVAYLCALLRRGDVRLVTLTGPGGIGKTRLALGTGEALLGAFGDGVLLVELAPLTTPAMVLPTIARALGRSESSTPLFDDLAGYLRGKRLLLLIDNLEHLLEAAPPLAQLLAAVPGLYILATSRATLGIPGEHEFVVPPLALPDPLSPLTVEQLAGCPATSLFIACARAARHSFEPSAAAAPAIATICRLLEGLPLAIELAAARVSMLSIEQIAARLACGTELLAAISPAAPPRQRTLEATLDWSYNLLGPQAGVALRRLAVFVGGWTLGAAEAVCAGEGLAPHEVLGLLTELRSKSFISVQIQHGEARYQMLEMVRQYARRQLEASGELAHAETRHLHHFAALIEQARPHLIAADQVVWFERLTLDLDNLRAALERAQAQALADPQPEALIRALAMPAGLERFWSPRGYSAEGAERVWRALGLPVSADPAVSQARAAALNAVSVLEMLQGNYLRATQAAEEARAFGEAYAHAPTRFAALRNLGTIAVLERNLKRGDALLQQCLALGRTSGPEANHSCAWALSVIGSAAYMAGDHTRARSLFEECARLLRALGDANFLALALRRLGQIALHEQELTQARALFQESLELNTSIDSPSGIAAGLIGLAGVLLVEGEAPEGARLLGVAQLVLEERAEHLTAADRELQQRCEAQARELLGEQQGAELLVEGRASALELRLW